MHTNTSNQIMEWLYLIYIGAFRFIYAKPLYTSLVWKEILFFASWTYPVMSYLLSLYFGTSVYTIGINVNLTTSYNNNIYL